MPPQRPPGRARASFGAVRPRSLSSRGVRSVGGEGHAPEIRAKCWKPGARSTALRRSHGGAPGAAEGQEGRAARGRLRGSGSSTLRNRDGRRDVRPGQAPSAVARWPRRRCPRHGAGRSGCLRLHSRDWGERGGEHAQPPRRAATPMRAVPKRTAIVAGEATSRPRFHVPDCDNIQLAPYDNAVSGSSRGLTDLGWAGLPLIFLVLVLDAARTGPSLCGPAVANR